MSSVSFGQIDGALVTRRGAVVQGTVIGSLVALDEAAEVTISKGGLVHGDLVLPADKTREMPAASNIGKSRSLISKLSPRAKVTVSNASSLKGIERVAAGFKLPKAETPRKPTGTETRVLASATGEDPDFKRVKDLTVKNSKREVAVPPGAYGEFVVESGRVLLGRKGFGPPMRYHFESLSVGVDASVDLLGPAIVVVGHLGSIQGKLGNDRYTQWLDLRVVSGAISFGPDSEIHGVVTAGDSAVAMGPRAKMRGGLICDSATVESTALFTGVSPSWSKESSGNSLPRFIHKAARLEQQLSKLATRYEDRYTALVEYVDDEPILKLTQAATAATRLEQHEERRAFFDACCTLLETTWFAAGKIIIVRRADTELGAPALEVQMRREHFEDHLRTIGRRKHPRDSIRRIRNDPLLLNFFMERSLKVAAGMQANR